MSRITKNRYVNTVTATQNSPVNIWRFTFDSQNYLLSARHLVYISRVEYHDMFYGILHAYIRTVIRVCLCLPHIFHANLHRGNKVVKNLLFCVKSGFTSGHRRLLGQIKNLNLPQQGSCVFWVIMHTRKPISRLF